MAANSNDNAGESSEAIYWDDLEVGIKLGLGHYFLSEQEIISFATLYDPQPFHTDPINATYSNIGIFCASGAQTIAVAQRLSFDRLYSRAAVVAGLGIDKVRFHRPVLPNEALSGHIVVKARSLARSNAERGLTTFVVTTTNPRDEVVATMETSVLFLRRPREGR